MASKVSLLSLHKGELRGSGSYVRNDAVRHVTCSTSLSFVSY